MKPVLVTQRVVSATASAPRRDALEDAWHPLFEAADLLPVLVPNRFALARALADGVAWSGLLLTGGNDLASVGGDAPARDEVETFLLERALAAGRPVLGVCRGMQLLLAHFGAALERVEGHVQPRQAVTIEGSLVQVNSYHDFGARKAPDNFEVWARADDGVVKAIRDDARRLTGVMWHPERMRPFRSDDVALLRSLGRTEEPCAG